MHKSSDQFLPDLNETSNSNHHQVRKLQSQDAFIRNLKQKSCSISSSSTTASSSSSVDEFDVCRGTEEPGLDNKTPLFNLPPLVSNSSIVRQRVSAKDSLAVASLSTGASLPLMLGGRTKCVMNHLVDTDDQLNMSSKSCAITNIDSTPQLPASTTTTPTIRTISPQPIQSGGAPRNTALRAEHRSCRQLQSNQQKHNVISVVRPVVSRSPIGDNHSESVFPCTKQVDGSALWTDKILVSKPQKGSLVDELMSLDQRMASSDSAGQGFMMDLNDSLASRGRPRIHQPFESPPLTEQQMQQQMAFYRREQFELNRNVRRQHEFVVLKIEERRRHLQIVRSVWTNKDFKHAIEKLIDIYHQGLIFTQDDEPNDFSGSKLCPRHKNLQRDISSQQPGQKAHLRSMNTSLVVDVLSVIILRPKLWTLEICQMILPILINDLLMQKVSPYEYYIEVAIKTIRLIITHFSTVIKTTLEGYNNSGRVASIGVDLSREDRINRCSNCYRLLLEARSLIARRLASVNSNVLSANVALTSQGTSINSKLANLCRELEHCFVDLKPFRGI